MPGKYASGTYQPAFAPRWKYRGGETLTMDGTPQACTIPDGAHIFEIRAESAAVYFNVNHANASAASPGYVANGAVETLGPLDTLTALTLWGAGGQGPAVAHVMYFEEA